jgi:DNA mismatch repair protein MutS
MIADGISPELDELRGLSRSSNEYLAKLDERERARPGINSLKVRFNKVFGYYLEVTASQIPKVPVDYIRKQTLTNAERYITPELKEFEGKILGAEEKIHLLEYELFCEIRDRASGFIPQLQAQAERVAQLDLLLCFARVAEEFISPVRR